MDKFSSYKQNNFFMKTDLLEIGVVEMPANIILPAVEQLKSLAEKKYKKKLKPAWFYLVARLRL